MVTDEQADKEQIVYAYGVAVRDVDLSTAPRGVDDSAVIAVKEGELSAICSLVRADLYTGSEIEARAGEVEWVGPRAVAHDAVLVWASDRAEVVPFTMFTLFSGSDAVRAMLRDRREALARSLERMNGAREFTLRVFQSSSPAAEAALAEGSQDIAELRRLAAGATPGQRYLLERKLDKALRQERSRRGAAVAAELAATLAEHSAAVVRSPLPPAPDADSGGRAVLDASCLVKHEGVDALRAALGAAVERFEPLGFRFEFTGPWPAYHFASIGE